MQIKRYEAKDMTSALRMVKEELGPEAVILSARTLRKGSVLFGTGKSIGVEVTAAIDAIPSRSNQRDRTAARRSAERPQDALRGYRQFMHPGAWADANDDGTGPMVSESTSQRSQSVRQPGSAPAAGLLNALHHQLLGQDVQRELAAALVSEIRRIPGAEWLCSAEEIRSHLRDLLREMDIRFHPFGAGADKPKLIAFVGPPGVGKTTTLAKLAARQAAAGKLSVGLIGLDGHRIGAGRELQTYADILGMPLTILGTPAALRPTLKKYQKCDLVYLDTAGIGFKDHQRLMELQQALAKIKRKEIHLLLSAPTRERDLTATIDRFKDLPVTCLGFTKLDGTSSYGVLINILNKTKIPLSLLGTGQRIPEDLATASVEALLDLILKEFMKMGNTAPAAGFAPERQRMTLPAPARFVANRNSDVYHRQECKWSSKIKPEHMVEFASIQEAESKQYLPCRTCNPNDDSLTRHASSTRDRVSLTGYR